MTNGPVVDPAAGTATDPAANPQLVNAFVFVPGISRTWGDQSLRQLADDMVVTMNQVTSGATFVASPGDPLSYSIEGRDRQSRRITITRADRASAGAAPVPVVDLFELDYVRNLAATYESRPILLRAGMVLYALVRGARQFLGVISPRRGGKTPGQRVQLLFLFGVLALYAAFLGILFLSIASTAADAFRAASDTIGVAAPSPSIAPSPSASIAPNAIVPALVAAQPGFIVAAIANALKFISLAGVLIWLLLPPKAKVKEGIMNTATDFLTIDYYLRSGTNATRLRGDLNGLLDAVREGRDGVAYRRVDLAAYSMGSIVAFNTLFPFGNPEPPGSPIETVDTFLTIGCPFDTIRLIRTGYFKNRRTTAGVPRGWVNVYAPNDILGSNFRDDNDQKAASTTVMAAACAGASTARAAIPAAATPGAAPADAATEVATTAVSTDFPVPDNLPYFAGGVPQGKGVMDALFGGLQAHVTYWDLNQEGESTCFDQIVPVLYGSDGTLGTPVTS